MNILKILVLYDVSQHNIQTPAGRQAEGTRVDDDDSFCREKERENYASSNNNGVGVGLEHSGG